MKKLFPILLLLICSSTFAQTDAYRHEIEAVLKKYEHYKEPLITTRLFKHADVKTLIQKHVTDGLLQNEIAGQSVQGRSIHHLTLGKGKTKVLLWSQMHGDEATATMALFDLFNFLSADDKFNSLKENLLSKLELHIVPMLNPDGAEIWTRTNNMKIDINRDAENLATPEARTLMDLAKKIKPDFGFNLHDQSSYYAAGKNTANPATISFLAPAFNVAKDMNPTRTRAVQVIAAMNNGIQHMIPNKVAKYNDTFDSRCFGDTFQSMGISAILIESGGYPDDPDKQVIRKVNFYAILTALTAIADETYSHEAVNSYWNLPNNANNLHNIILRNAAIKVDGTPVRTSLAINRAQRTSTDALTFNYIGQIVKTEKLDSVFAYQDLDVGELEIVPGKTIVMSKYKWDNLTPFKEFKLVKKGYTYVKWEDSTSPVEPIKNRILNLTNTPINDAPITVGPSNFLLTKNGKPVYAVINGFLVDLKKSASPLPNTMGY
jgi:hypothetical protein